MKVSSLAPHFQIEMKNAGRINAMVVHVEAASPLDDDGKKVAASDLAKRIKDVVGVTADIHVRDVGDVARSEGKAIRVIDNRKKD